jgi:SAM-dependent methyltransferase
MMKEILGRLLGGSGAPARPPQRAARQWDPEVSAEDFVELCFRIILGRIPKEFEQADHRRRLESGVPRGELRRGFIHSPEFLLRRRDWIVKLPPPAGPDPVLDALGADDRFIALCYEFLLERPADAGGVEFALTHLRDGQPRGWVIRTLATSREFNDRFAGLSDTGAPPVDVQLCELANPAKWDNPEWLGILASYVAIPDHKEAMHRKGYEFTQLAFGLRKLGWLRDDVRVLSVGAGHEAPAFWLANHAGSVIATDLYEGEWQSIGGLEGDARVLARPEDFAPFPYRRERLTFMKMNGCQLGFADEAFDVVYSLSSIEHFGGVAGARAAVAEMARVVKRGGIVAVATEWAVQSPGAEEVFAPEEVRHIIDHPHLRLVQPIDDRVYDRYAIEAVDVRATPLRTPHMLLRKGETLFTSVMMFLERR